MEPLERPSAVQDRHYHSAGREGTAVGVDLGATLAKLAIQETGGDPRFLLLATDSLHAVARAISELSPARVGLTGCGAPRLAALLPSSSDTARVGEFDAWGTGADALLGAAGPGADEGYLLVSVGTGTAMMQVRSGRATHLGGTPLGGGAILGLGRWLAGVGDHDALCDLALRGDRRRVDLTLADIYPEPGDAPLPLELTAAAFARLARPDGAKARPEDLARALLGMVGENVAILAGSLARAAGLDRIVFGGSTLRANPVLREVLADIGGRLGRRVDFLEQGEFGGALGALIRVRARAPTTGRGG